MRPNQATINPAAERIKAVGASPLMLITCIIALLGVLSTLLGLLNSLIPKWALLSTIGAGSPNVIFASISLFLSLLPCIGLWLIFANSKKALKNPVPYRIGGAGFIKAYCIIYLVLICIALLGVIICFGIILSATAIAGAGGNTVLIIAIVMAVAVLFVVLVIIYYAKIIGFLGNARETAAWGARVKGSMYVVIANFIVAFFLLIGLVVRFAVTQFVNLLVADVADYVWSYFDVNLYEYLSFGVGPLTFIDTFISVLFLILVSILLIKYKRSVTKAFAIGVPTR